MTDDQINHMVDRFLSWKLPRDTFNPDCGISFNKAPINTDTPWPSQYEPSGTNLFDAMQADAMVRHMVDGLPGSNDVRDLSVNFGRHAAPADAEPVAVLVEELRSRADVAEAEGSMTAQCDAHYFRKAADALAARPASPVMAEVEKALDKFTAHYSAWMGTHSDDNECIVHSRHTFGDLKAARAALAKLRAERGDAVTRPQRSTQSIAPK
jgi:hypothetical protein